MSKTDIGPPNFREMIPEVINKNYGRWIYHETLKPGVLRHVAESGDEVYTVRVGSPRLVSVDFIRDLCDIADQYCDGHLRFTSRYNVEFLTPKKANVEPIIKAAKKMPSGRRDRRCDFEYCPHPGVGSLPQCSHGQFPYREGPDGRALSLLYQHETSGVIEGFSRLLH